MNQKFTYYAREYWHNYFNLQGRSSFSDCSVGLLIVIIWYLLTFVVGYVLSLFKLESIVHIFTIISMTIVLIPMVTTLIRRLNDMGFTIKGSMIVFLLAVGLNWGVFHLLGVSFWAIIVLLMTFNLICIWKSDQWVTDSDNAVMTFFFRKDEC